MEEEEDAFTNMSVKELKTWITTRGGNMTGLVEKHELMTLARRLASVPATKPPPATATARPTTTTTSDNSMIFTGVNMPPISKLTSTHKVLIMLHGFGADNRQFDFLQRLIPNADSSYFIVQPKSKAMGWFPLESVLAGLTSGAAGMLTLQTLLQSSPDGLTEARTRVLTLYRELIRIGNIAPRNVILGGFSQGATVALDCALELEETCGGVFAFSGFPLDLKRWKKNAARHGSKLKVLSTHGRSDGLIPFLASSFIREALREGHVRVETVDHDGGHELGQESLTAVLRCLKEW